VRGLVIGLGKMLACRINEQSTTGGNDVRRDRYLVTVCNRQWVQSVSFGTAIALCLASTVAAQTDPASDTVASDTVASDAAASVAAALDDWNSAQAVSLVERAIQARSFAYADSSLRSFRADAQGHIYFLAEFQGEREVIRADQVALDVRWEAPDRTLQTIVGRRHEIRLPTSVRYHIDHLSLVLDNFGDRIRLGDGDEVWNVLHPAATAAFETYEYRLVDSLEIRIQDGRAQVFELEVRPLDTRNPGVVGSIFVDRHSGAIARMRFTFTEASYRDPELVRIVLDLRSAFWDGKYWLPAVQDLEITRSLSWFEFPIETVIRTRLEVFDYALNEASGLRLSTTGRVASLPGPALASFEGWKAPLYGGPLDAAERSDEELEAAVRDARSLVGQRGLRSGRRFQLSLPNASAGMRVRRAEGLLVGAGGVYRFDDRTLWRFWGGYPTEARRFEATTSLERDFGVWTLGVEGRLRSIEDVGFRAASGAVQTLALATAGEDYQDPYFQDGVRVSASRRSGAGRVSLGASAFRQQPARLTLQTQLFTSRPLRPVRPTDPGDLVAIDGTLELGLGRGLGASWEAKFQIETATTAIGDFGFTRGTIRLRAERDGFDSGWAWSSDLLLGLSGGDLPAQRLFLLGGRGTLPGYTFRPWGGDRVALWRGEVSRSVLGPWVRIRALAAAGWTDLGSVGGSAAARFGATETGGIRTSAGLGLGLIYDLVRLDLMRGLDGVAGEVGGDWALHLSLDPFLWGIL